MCDGNHQELVETHTVTYNANGGVVTPNKSEVEEGKSTVLPKPTKTVDVVYYGNGGTNVPAIVNIQLNCLGWAKSSNSTSGEYICGSSYSPDKDITLYAVWQKRYKRLNKTVYYSKENYKSANVKHIVYTVYYAHS